AGAIVAVGTTDANGRIEFASLSAGTYTIEVVSATGEVLGTSAPVTVSTGSAAPCVVPAAAALGVLASAGKSAGVMGWVTSTKGIATAVLAASGATAAIIATRDEASPSR
ncbi:MAG TPA: SpaA isopeptide-forming pilin-related protein, partial [Vicinamibacterales bacterium]|nr:SpaA isopeptide-forming pilin-related protein [Vicinamibacterales bacterium]